MAIRRPYANAIELVEERERATRRAAGDGRRAVGPTHHADPSPSRGGRTEAGTIYTSALSLSRDRIATRRTNGWRRSGGGAWRAAPENGRDVHPSPPRRREDPWCCLLSLLFGDELAGGDSDACPPRVSGPRKYTIPGVQNPRCPDLEALLIGRLTGGRRNDRHTCDRSKQGPQRVSGHTPERCHVEWSGGMASCSGSRAPPLRTGRTTSCRPGG